MRGPIEVLAKGVDRHDDAGQAVGQVQRGAQVFEEALVRDAAEVFEQVAVIAEVWAQHLGNAEGEVAVRYRDQREKYTNAKSDVFWEIIARADEWAAFSGWEPGPSDA